MVFLFLLFLFFSFPPATTAQQKTTVDADRIFQEAESAFEHDNLHEALEKYEAALKLYQDQKNLQGMADTFYKLARTNGRLGHFPEASKLLEQALKLHEELGDLRGAGLDYTRIAIAQERQGNYIASLSTSEKALAINEKTGNWEGIAITIDNSGNCYYRQGEFEKAIEAFQRALPAAEKSGDRRNVSTVLGDLGQVYWAQGDYPRALEIYIKAQKIAEEANDPENLAATVANIGLIYWDQGDLPRAREELDRSLKLFQRLGNQAQIAGHYMNMGSFRHQIGDYQGALESLQLSIKMAEDINDKGLQADALGELGRIYEELGESDAALNYIQRALRLSQETGEKGSEIDILLDLGYLQQRQKNLDAALDTFRKAQQLCDQTDFKKQSANTLQRIAEVYEKQGEHDKELETQKQMLALRESLGDRAAIGESHMLIGSTYLAKGDLANADAELTKAIAILREVDWPDVLWPALYKKALVFRDMGKTSESLQLMKEAVQIIDHLRGTLDLLEQKSAFLEERFDVYEDLVLLLVKTGDVAGGFEYSERARSRAFLDLLSEARINPQSGLSGEQYEKKRELLTQLVNLREKIREEHEKDEPDAGMLQRFMERQGKLDADYLDLMIQIRKQNPRYAKLQDPEPIQYSQVQTLIDPHSAVVEYFVGENESVLFVVTFSKIAAFRLPGEQKLDEQVRGLQEAIQKPEPVWEATSGSYTRYKTLACGLYSEIIKPAEALLNGKTRIIIVPDGPLHYLPFESLLTGESAQTADFSALPYLGLKFETQYIPSLTALAALRSSSHVARRGQRKDLIAFANPLGDAGGAAPHSEGMDATVREWSSKLSALPYSGMEAEEISKLFSKQRVTVMIGKDASETNVKRAALNQYRIVHFASHGLIDEDQPQFSSLVLNPGDASREDGFLTMREIFDLKLDADLVVLSACKTGLGRAIRGEGIAGLSRAFFAAGTSRVVVSLWNVFDTSTAQFMTTFYQNLKKRNIDTAMALKEARRKMILGKKYSHPYYWAPFILLGDN